MKGKKKKKSSPPTARNYEPTKAPLTGKVSFPASDEKDAEEINNVGYLVKSKTVDREDFLS